MFHLGEFEGAVQAVEGDGEIGRTGDGLGLWREAKQSSGPGCGAGNCGIVREVGQRRGTGRPGLGEAVPERDAEGDVLAAGGEVSAKMRRGIAPGAEVLGEGGDGGAVTEAGVDGEQSLAVEGVEDVVVAGSGGNDHDGVREQCGIGVLAAEGVNDFVNQGVHTVTADSAGVINENMHGSRDDLVLAVHPSKRVVPGCYSDSVDAVEFGRPLFSGQELNKDIAVGGRCWYAFQQELFPSLESELGPMGERYELFVTVLELVRVEALLPYFRGQVGRPEEDRAALARAFIAKAVFDVPTTRALIERLEVDGRLRRLCGWSGGGRLPSEATFSRAFSEFAESGLASRLHETLIARTMDGHLVEHISRDATAIEAREKPRPKPKGAKPKQRKRGRPRKGEERAKEASRLERQLTMTLPQMLADLPRACDVGTKRNAKGHTTSWIGYKLHVDTADGGVPISCIMTSASTHDSQVAIPLGTVTAGRVENLYDLMDAAYDSIEIWAHSIALGHKPIIDVNPRRSVDMQEALKREKTARRTLGLVFPEERRYVVRSGSERVNGRLKDEFGGRHVRVRGYDKVLAHLMFGMTVLAASQLMRLIVPPI